jgi:glycosyltransferase involved in cell wall biosynthesis
LTTPKISIVIPVYNSEKYLNEAIESILAQTFKDFELILINDGSTDRTEEIIKSYMSDPRVVYEKNVSNKGIVFSLNRGIELARAEIIARMDADDVAAPERLELQYDFLRQNPEIVLVGSNVELIDSEGRSLGKRSVITGPENIRRVFFYYGPHRHPTTMFRKEAVESIGGYRDYLVCQDIDLYFRLILSGMKTDNLPAVLLKYRVHPENSDKHFREKAVIGLEIKKSAINEFNFRPGPVNYASMYIHYALDSCLSPRRKHQVETAIKSVVDRYERFRGRTAGLHEEMRTAFSINERSGRLVTVRVLPEAVKTLISKAGSFAFHLVWPHRSFSFRGDEYAYLYHPYKLAWYTERGVEVPIVMDQVKDFRDKEILEVGHVLGHYYPVCHDVVDKYEVAPGVVNVDIVDYDTEKRYDLIVSVSTIEHIGYDEYPKDPAKAGVAVERLIRLLASGGRMFLTIPLGYNPEVDRLVREEWPGVSDIYYMRKTSWRNDWEQTTADLAFQGATERRFFWINALAVLVFYPVP